MVIARNGLSSKRKSIIQNIFDMNIKPLADRVVIRPAQAEEKNSFWNHHP
jgi:hypothetical protein